MDLPDAGMHQPFCADSFWNRTSFWDTGSPQLSSCFRSLALRLAPCAILVILSPVDLLTPAKKRPVAWKWPNILRIAFACLAALVHGDFFLVLIDEDSEETRGSATPLSALVVTVSFLWTACLLGIGKKKGFVRSGTVWIFVFTSTACAAFEFLMENRIQLRTLEDVTALSSLTIDFILLCLCFIADTPKPHKGKIISVRETASFPSCVTFSWADTLAYTGWKRMLQQEDMHALQDFNKTSYLGQLLQKYLIHYNEKGVKVTRSLAIALLQAFKWDMMYAAILKLISDMTALATPLILKWLLSYAEEADEPQWHGYVIAFLLCVFAQVSSISQNYHYDSTLTTGVRLRTALMTCIYQKSLSISNAVRTERSVGEIVNLMSIDADRFILTFEELHVLWSGPVMIAAGIYLLYLEVNVGALAALTVLLLLMPVNLILASLMPSSQKSMMQQKDQRINLMSELLSGIKVIKLYAWEEAFMSMIRRIREREVLHLTRLALLDTLPFLVWGLTPALVTLATFATYVLLDPNYYLNASKVFFCLSILNVIRIPLLVLVKQFNMLANVTIAVKRLDEFFAAEDLKKYVTREEDVDCCVRIEKAVLKWDDGDTGNSSSDFSLEVDLKIKNGWLIAIVGVVGSGKSSLLSAILGEMQLMSGRVNISPSIKKTAYVPQQAWILNDSLKGNIVFGMDAFPIKYQSIVRTCELEPDLLLLPAGDRTEIGEKGINLSGGQRQRISIARACYSDADLFLFDDPLSAVDAHVGKKLFQNVFSNKSGLLRGKTRILVTNNRSFLHEVDNIIVLVGGRIAESGSYAELMKKGGAFARSIVDLQCNPTPMTGSHDEVRIRKTSSTTESLKSSSSTDPLLPSNQAELIKEEARESGGVSLSLFINYFRSMPFFWAVCLCFMLNQVLEAGSNYWLSLWSQDQGSRLVKMEDTRGSIIDTLETDRIRVFAMLGLSAGLFFMIGSVSLAIGTVKAAVRMHQNLLTGILHSPMQFFETTPSGRILNRFSKDMDGIDLTILLGLFYVFPLTGQAVGTVVMIMIAIPAYILAIIPLSLIFFTVQRYNVSTARQVRRLESATRSQIYSQFSETLAGVSSIRAYAVEDGFVSQFDQRTDNNASCTLSSYDMMRWRTTRLEFIGNLTLALAALMSVIYKGSIDPGLAGMALMYSMTLPRTLDKLVKGLSDVEMEAVAIERVVEYSNNDSEASWYKDQKPAADWPSKGHIRFINYSARYRPDMDLVLKDISLDIRAGEKVGIVGRTGAGKSTITLSLFRIIEPASGSIIIDDVDVISVGLHDLRSRLSIIPQDSVLFSGTLRANIDPVGDKTDHQIWDCLEAAHLKDFASKLDQKLDHFVSEGGGNLSAGQRQLLCLARALLRKTKILVLDEATAAVDMETDALIQETIRSKFDGCTILTIAHRLSTILDYDRVLVMDEGTVAEFDDPNNLLTDKNSLLYSLAADAGLV